MQDFDAASTSAAQRRSSRSAAIERFLAEFAPGEHTSLGSFRRELFNGVCAFCHGSLSGFEGDISPRPDVLTGASVTMSSP